MPDLKVDTAHEQYGAMIERWQACRDCYEGEYAVKARGDAYLPRLDSHAVNPEAYKAYVKRAVYFNATGRSVEGLTGAVHQKAPTVKVPKDVEPLLEDVTLGGESFDMLAQRVTRDDVNLGRFGILVEHPPAPKAGAPPSKTPARPYMVGYVAEDIINWRAERIDGDQVLTMVVLRELKDAPTDDPFVTEKVVTYRVLTLLNPGLATAEYKVQIYEKLKDAAGHESWTITFEDTPARRGLKLTFIPFVFFGPLGTTPDVRKSPVQDLVDLNLSHYRTMADLQHALHYTALPTPYVTGAFGDSKAPLLIGSAAAWVLPQGATAGMLQVTGGFEGLRTDEQQKREMMATVGARLLESGMTAGPPETAFAVSMRHAGEHATLRTIVQSVEAGLKIALRWLCWWTATAADPLDIEVTVELNKDFFALQMSAADATAWLTNVQNGGISMKTAYYNLERGGVTRPNVTVEEEMKDIVDEKKADTALNAELFPDLMAANGAPGTPGGPPNPNAPPQPQPPVAGGTKNITIQRDANGRAAKLKVKG
jgi:hypothetical protein